MIHFTSPRKAGFFYALYTKTAFCCLLDMKFNINIPESLNDITLGQYQNFLQIEEPTNEDLLKCFMNLNPDYICKMKDKDVTKLIAQVNSLFEKEQKHILKFNLKGVSYGFIPKIDDITYGENKDVTRYTVEEDPLKPKWENMNKAMTVLYRPITMEKNKKYLIEKYEGTRERSELMRQMPLSVAMGAMVFFYNLTTSLLNSIPNYLLKQSEQMQGQLSEENGEAIKRLTYSLKVRLQGLLEFPQIHQSQSTRSIAV